MFILLVGPPGTRKTTSMNNVKHLLQRNTNVRFAPKDTAGQRQGLITAMQGETQLDLGDINLDTLLIGNEFDALDQVQFTVNHADRHTLYACAAEFRSFLGQNNLDLTGFLLEMWDGESYDYQLKTTKVTLDDPLLSLIGCTTPTEISSLLPAEATGQGFMSRFVLVHSAEKYKKIPPSKAYLDKRFEGQIINTFQCIATKMNGPFKLSAAAAEFEDHLYMTKHVQINDTRFMYYLERRHTHIMKIACALAASRAGEQIIEADDIAAADAILSETEKGMPDALGEFGLSPLALAKQRLAEFIQHAKGPVTSQILWMVMRGDMKLVDFKNSLSEMVNAGKIARIDTSSGQAFVYNDDAGGALKALMGEEG